MFKEVFFETNWIRIKNMIGKYLSFSNIISCSFWIFVWHLKRFSVISPENQEKVLHYSPAPGRLYVEK